jgi:chemotaxis family two-component system response regulator Rcp1
MEILLVEDNLADVRLITEAFKGSKIIKQCHVVKDGIDALKFLKKEEEFSHSPVPDVIILDLNLPGKNGFEVLTELKNNISLVKIPVVILTCSNNEEHVRKCYDLFANCYIVKPTEFNEFEEVVKRIESFWGNVATLPIID